MFLGIYPSYFSKNNLRKGENMEVNDRLYDLIIIGGGPARTFCRYIYGKSKTQNINT